MGRSDQLFGISALFVLESGPERIRGLCEDAGIGGKIAVAGATSAAPNRFRLADHGSLRSASDLLVRSTCMGHSGNGRRQPSCLCVDVAVCSFDRETSWRTSSTKDLNDFRVGCAPSSTCWPRSQAATRCKIGV